MSLDFNSRSTLNKVASFNLIIIVYPHDGEQINMVMSYNEIIRAVQGQLRLILYMPNYYLYFLF